MPWVGLLVPVVVALVTGYFAYRVGTRKDANNTQAALHKGFKILIDELQAERDRLAARLSKLIDAGNDELKREMAERFSEIEARIEHNRRNADHNFGIINEIIQDQIAATVAAPAQSRGKRRRLMKIVPQKLRRPDE